MDNDDGPPYPPQGSNYRRTRRRTNYFHRAVASITVQESRLANELVHMASVWIVMAMQHIMMCMQNVSAMICLPNPNQQHCLRIDDQFEAIKLNAAHSLSLAAECYRIAASTCVTVRRLIFYSTDDLHRESILSVKPKRFRIINKLDNTTAIFLTGFNTSQLSLMVDHLRFPEFLESYSKLMNKIRLGFGTLCLSVVWGRRSPAS